MKGYKNINSINEVKKVLKSFQVIYTKKDINGLDEVIENLFSSREGITALGSGMGEWCFNKSEIKGLIKSHLDRDNKYWKEIDFKLEEARIFATENAAWVISIGNIKDTITEDEQAEKTMEAVKELVCKEDKSEVNALKAAFKLAVALNDIDKGENYVWPFRFSSFLIKENGEWKFYQMQFSLGANYFWQYRSLNEDYDKNLFEMPVSNLTAETEEVRKVLKTFQDGYTRRDINYVDEYMKEVFVFDEEQVVIGTDAEELCIGPDSIKGIIESDWKYWGDFRANMEGALISVFGDVACFTTKAIIKRITSKEQILEWIGSSTDYIFKTDGRAKDKLMQSLSDITMFLYESERGETYVAPMRFSGVLVKTNGKWKIHHAQYSDYIDGMPEARTVV